MPDTVSKDKRFQIMQANKRRGNKSTELKLIEIFKKYGIKGWRRRFKLFGSPDFVFPKERTAIFTDGCFWHGHNCRNTKPSTNKEYWDKKIASNKKHDRKVNRTLKEKKWKVIRIWECELKKGGLPKKLISFKKSIDDGSKYLNSI
jgi:DNA mismatch endonuclease (patch repair protein)